MSRWRRSLGSRGRRLWAGMIVLAGMVLLWRQTTIPAGVVRRSTKEILASVDLLLVQGELDSASLTLRHSLALDSANAELWLSLARVERMRGRPAARSQALQRVFRLRPRTIDGRLELIPDLLDRHKSDSALVMARQVCELSGSTDPMGWYFLGRAFQQSSQFDSASAAFQRAYSILGPELF